jgi:hypothetical protein
VNGKSTIWLLALAGCGAAAFFYSRSAGASESDQGGDGNSSLGGASGSAAGALSGAAESLSDFASEVGYNLGINTPRGLRNHNPFNLRYYASIPWNGQQGDDGGGYAVFDTDENGVRAGGHQLKTYAGRGLTSVQQIIQTFAPSNENDTVAYITDVSRRLGVDPDQPLDVYGLLPQLADAIIHHEQGVQPFSMDQLTQWVYEA